MDVNIGAQLQYGGLFLQKQKAKGGDNAMYIVILQVHKQRPDIKNTQEFLFHPKSQYQTMTAVLPRGLPCSSSGKLSHSGLWIDMEVNKVDKSLLADFCGSVGLRWVLMLCMCFIAFCKVSSISLMCWLGYCQKVM